MAFRSACGCPSPRPTLRSLGAVTWGSRGAPQRGQFPAGRILRKHHCSGPVPVSLLSLQGIRLLPVADAHLMPTASGRTGVELGTLSTPLHELPETCFQSLWLSPPSPKGCWCPCHPTPSVQHRGALGLPQQLPASPYLCPYLGGPHWEPSSLGVWQLCWHQKLGAVGSLLRFCHSHIGCWTLRSSSGQGTGLQLPFGTEQPQSIPSLPGFGPASRWG